MSAQEDTSIEPTDAQLIAAVQCGDLQALGGLYERHKALVYRTALAITRDEKMAEDIMQEVFLRLYRYAGRVDTALPLEPWLYRVTVNTTYRWINRARRWLQNLHGVIERWAGQDGAAASSEAVAEQHEAWRDVQRAIDALPPAHQAVIVLHYLEGLDLDEIADVLGVPEGTVKSRLHYARRRLKRVLEDQRQWVVPEVAYDFT